MFWDLSLVLSKFAILSLLTFTLWTKNVTAQQISEKEHEADVIKDDIRKTIPKRFFLPVYRGDLLAYLKQQDDMADSAEDVAVLLNMKSLLLPEELTETVFTYIGSVLSVCEKAYEISNFLPNLVKAGFEGREVDTVLQMIATLEKQEHESDQMQFHLSQKLFALEDQLKPTDVFLWFKIFGELGNLADYAEKIGDRLRRMIST